MGLLVETRIRNQTRKKNQQEQETQQCGMKRYQPHSQELGHLPITHHFPPRHRGGRKHGVDSRTDFISTPLHFAPLFLLFNAVYQPDGRHDTLTAIFLLFKTTTQQLQLQQQTADMSNSCLHHFANLPHESALCHPAQGICCSYPCRE